MPPSTDDTSRFPAPVYTETVLAPLFDLAKRHYRDDFQAVDRAHLVMLAETAILDRPTVSAIARALDAIGRELDVGALVYTGEQEDLFFVIEAELKRRLGPDVAGRLHTGRSRNDIDHTLFKRALKRRIDGLAGQARALAETLLAVARRESSTLIVAYTHGQPAQPTTFGHYLSAALEVLLRDLARLAEARRVVDLSPMGAAAITTSGFPIDRHRMAALLGFSGPLENSYGCIAAVDYVTATYGAVQLLFLHLGRLIQDLQTWSSFEVGQLYVPNAFVQISSIMPQKRNPVPIEHLRLLASHAAGRAAAMLAAVHNTPFTDMNDSEGETQAQGYGAFELGGRALALLAGLIDAVRIDGDRVRANIDRSCITVTELADSLVRLEGLSFREAHEVAAAVARAVVAAGATLGAGGHAAFTAAFETRCGRPSRVTSAQFQHIVSPEHFVTVRARFGGPAPATLDAAFRRYAGELAALADDARVLAEREAAAAHELAERFAALAAAAA